MALLLFANYLIISFLDSTELSMAFSNLFHKDRLYFSDIGSERCIWSVYQVSDLLHLFNTDTFSLYL